MKRNRSYNGLGRFFLAVFFLLGAFQFSYASDKPQKVKILFTHDLHSHFDGSNASSGGYARLFTAINRERADKSFTTILVDAGDFSMGTLYQTLFTEESAELTLMTIMGYDAGTLGNHDFDFYNSGLAKALLVAKAKNRKPMPLVSANITFSRAADKASLELPKVFARYPVTDTLIIKRGGIKFGVFGLMGKNAAIDAPYAKPASFEDPVLSAARAVDKLKKEGADIIICLSHSGTWKEKANSEDEILAAKVPGIDFIVSGHTHTVLKKPIVIEKTAIGSCGSYGQYLGVAELEFRDAQAKLTGYRIIPMDEKIPQDAGIEKHIEKYRALIGKKYLSFYGYRFERKIASSQFGFQPIEDTFEKNPWESSMGDLVTDSYRYSITKAEGKDAKPVDIAVSAIGMIRQSFLKGVISVPDIFEVLSLGIGADGRAGYPLYSCYITGDDVLRMLEIGPSLAPMGNDGFWLMYSGLRYTFDTSRPAFQRIRSAEIVDGEGKAEPVVKDKLYRVCMSSYLVKMLGYVRAMSKGIINIMPKDSAGNVISDPRRLIVDANPGKPGNHEIKEWTALAEYLASFPVPEKEQLPVIPDRYKLPQGRAVPVKQ